MADHLSAKNRSALMARIGGKDTAPELRVRKIAHGLGFRYRLHGRGLPGRPDLVFRGRRKVIFVHGCFWHGHSHCKRGALPKSNVDYWNEKIDRNRERDHRQVDTLKAEGWDVLVIWECETKNLDILKRRIEHFLE